VRFESLPIEGVWVIHPEPHSDERGHFARTFCAEEFSKHGLASSFVQMSVSHNLKAGTLRGMHFQYPPSAETKVVRCVSGAIADVIVDLRPESPTFCHHVCKELTATNGQALYIPPRFAHGFMTLTDDATVTYMMDEFYSPGHEGIIAFDDPDLALPWPRTPLVIAERDRMAPTWRAQQSTTTERMSQNA
jgi:dTDP-4-dehydrorhamnose 3,5-epimerase